MTRSGHEARHLVGGGPIEIEDESLSVRWNEALEDLERVVGLAYIDLSFGREGHSVAHAQDAVREDERRAVLDPLLEP